MRRVKVLIATLCVVAMVLAGATLAAGQPVGVASAPVPGGLSLQSGEATQGEYVPGQVIVKFKPGVNESGKRRISMTVGSGAVLSTIGPPEGEKAEVIGLKPGVTVKQAVAQLSARSDVLYAEPNYIRHLTYQPNDPLFSDQWGLNNTGQTIDEPQFGRQTGKPDADMDVPEAWNIERGFSHPVTIAVLDSGVDLGHPDLKPKLRGDGYNFTGITQSQLDEWLSIGVDGMITPGPEEIVQTIQGTGQKLTDFGFGVRKVGSPAGGIGVEVHPHGSSTVLSHYIVANFEIDSSGTVIYKPLSKAITLQNGALYDVFITPNAISAYDYYEVAAYGGYHGDPYVEGSIWEYYSAIGWQENPMIDLLFYTNPNGSPHDDHGHGTHVSGITAAVTGNGIGVAGVCPGAKILPIKVADCTGSCPDSWVMPGVYYAVSKGANIINMSLGGPGKSKSFQDACTYAYNKGCTVFAAAGNEGNGTFNYPASYDHVISVGATTNKDQKASFSQYNKSVDLCAPGQSILSTLPRYDCWISVNGSRNLSYDFVSGTSQASPMAAGVGALLKAHNPSMTPLQIEQRLESTADDLGTRGRDDYYGYGRINAARALKSSTIFSTYYLAEGSTNWGYDCYISIENPNTTAVTAQITYMTGTGAVKAPGVSLPAMSQATINPRDVLGNKDFSTKVACKEGKAIAVDRTMSWTGPGAASPEAHSSVGVVSSSKTWYLPEGSSQWGFECWLCIQNPNTGEASCDITYMIEGSGPKTVNKKVPASTRQSFNIADDIGAADASIKVQSSVPVIAERSMYRNNRREGHNSIGTTSPNTNFYLAEGTSAYGFTTYVLVQNPNSSPTDVTVTYMTPNGPLVQPTFQMPANSRKTIRVNDVNPSHGYPIDVSNTDFSTQVHGSAPIIAERSMYWDNGTGEACHDSVGMASAHTSFYLPDGQTSDGRETYTVVQNPNSVPVTIQITYMTPDGKGDEVFTDTMPSNSRKTYNMATYNAAGQGIQGRAAVMVTSKTAGKKIMCERAMYWNNRGAGTDTIGGYSD